MAKGSIIGGSDSLARGMSVLAILGGLLLGCEADARNDATLFLDRVQRLDLDDPMEERARLVESLESLPLTAPEIREARDACVDAHRAILDAEELHVRAREAVVGAGQDEANLSAAERARIEHDIEESNSNIERSRNLFTRCHRLTRDIEVRYRDRRSSARET